MDPFRLEFIFLFLLFSVFVEVSNFIFISIYLLLIINLFIFFQSIFLSIAKYFDFNFKIILIELCER